MKYFQFFSKIMNKYLWKNSNFSTFSRVYFYSLKSFPFYLEYHESKFLGLFCLKQATKMFQFLDQNHGLTRLFVKCLVSWDACGTPTVKIRFGCIQNTPIQEKTGSRMETRPRGPWRLLAVKTNAHSKKFLGSHSIPY